MKENENLTEDTKERYSIFIHQATIELVKNNYKQAGFKCASDYVEAAVKFYYEYSQLQSASDLLSSTVTNILKDILREHANKQGRMMFKMAVELSIMMNVIAAEFKIDELTLDRLRGACTNEVKRINGAISFEDAVRWQS